MNGALFACDEGACGYVYHARDPGPVPGAGHPPAELAGFAKASIAITLQHSEQSPHVLVCRVSITH
jgi:hypothetical protein